jgi:hypothetical protein
MMLHQDGSRQVWREGRPPMDLIVTLDDATSKIYSVILVEEEGTASTSPAKRLKRIAEVVLRPSPVERHTRARLLHERPRERPQLPPRAAPSRSHAHQGAIAHYLRIFASPQAGKPWPPQDLRKPAPVACFFGGPLTTESSLALASIQVERHRCRCLQHLFFDRG